MKKTVAILMDGHFVKMKIESLLNKGVDFEEEPKKHATPNHMCSLAYGCKTNNEEVFRIYYYDSLPFDETLVNPISGIEKDYAATKTYEAQNYFYKRLSMNNGVAFRKGKVRCSSWCLKYEVEQALIREAKKKDGNGEEGEVPRPIRADQLKPEFRQKQVDIKIGLDVAWLASKRIVDRIILITGDEDLVPAMKFARREGVQVVLVALGHLVRHELIAHADEMRQLDLPKVLNIKNKETKKKK